MKTDMVTVIDDVLARQYWPGEDAIGQQINFGGNSPWMTIVGIVAHAKSSSLESDTTEGFYYLPIAQQGVPMAGVMVQTKGTDPEGVAPAMQAAIRRVDPSQPLYDLTTGLPYRDELLGGWGDSRMRSGAPLLRMAMSICGESYFSKVTMSNWESFAKQAKVDVERIVPSLVLADLQADALERPLLAVVDGDSARMEDHLVSDHALAADHSV